MSLRPNRLALLLTAAAAVAAVTAPVSAAASGNASTIRGHVAVAGSAVEGASVDLYLAGATAGAATLLSTETTDRLGRFRMSVPDSIADDAVLYAAARGGAVDETPIPDAVELATSLGDIRSGKAEINELTTVAAGYSLAQFAADGMIGGPAPGLQNAALMPRNLVDLDRGVPARFLLLSPNGTSTETLATFNSLASIITGCALGANDCDAFLDAATDAWGVRPATTWQAMTLLPTNPSGDAPGVFAQIPADPEFTPVRTSAPSGWVIALRFYGNGRQFNGPGNVAFDAQGKVWANNNTNWSRLPSRICPGTDMFHLDPYAPRQPMETFTGGGLNGAGFGIAIDTRDRVWVGNFGFTGSECKEGPPTSNSVSAFQPDGEPISGDDGFTDGPLSWPQGVKSDVAGNMWIANCGNDSVVVYPDGDNTRSFVAGSDVPGASHVPKAFDVAQNTEGSVFVTANAGNQVYGFASDGSPLPGSPFGDSSTIRRPLGAASDSLGNVWVSNSGVVDIPCSTGSTLEAPAPGANLDGTVARVDADGSTESFGGAGLTVPWGIAVDGDDNLWVANFADQRLSHLCGARASTCPAGTIGHPISPDEGYGFDGLQRNTGVQVDPSGNVWLANNWVADPRPIDPFGDGLVVYLGMAEPVQAPLVGPPVRP
ncbi:NHL repeat-containing protein [Agromyces sp. NPDC058484]|uniref:NHL repeat-containing protein n=1 Tax=Agromyces sp. NPDC058484 TaxID=3346524 RepID=UPI00365EB5A3